MKILETQAFLMGIGELDLELGREKKLKGDLLVCSLIFPFLLAPGR